MTELDNILSEIDRKRVPRHVAIIMDGNGRWAKSRSMARTAGHTEGVNTVRSVTETASDLGVEFLTLYAFSTENWNRPKEEVDALMHLIVVALERETPRLIRNNVRLTMIGDFDRMPAEALARLRRCMADTAGSTGLTLVLALSYSSRWEIARAARLIAEEAAAGKLNPATVTPELFSHYLTTDGMPDPDLLIRTGGDQRISNFLLWQVAYSEFYITPTLWPDFDKTDFCRAILAYQGRERRFGLTSEQVTDRQTGAAPGTE
ncbi:MAG: isoprenyl transferase [Clostridium sp.]|nr:isoprenyl transferase [Clostridium sp.]